MQVDWYSNDNIWFSCIPRPCFDSTSKTYACPNLFMLLQRCWKLCPTENNAGCMHFESWINVFIAWIRTFLHFEGKAYMFTTVAVLAKISFSSPRKLFVFIIKKYIFRIKVSQKKIYIYIECFEKKLHWCLRQHTPSYVASRLCCYTAPESYFEKLKNRVCMQHQAHLKPPGILTQGSHSGAVLIF